MATLPRDCDKLLHVTVKYVYGGKRVSVRYAVQEYLRFLIMIDRLC